MNKMEFDNKYERDALIQEYLDITCHLNSIDSMMEENIHIFDDEVYYDRETFKNLSKESTILLKKSEIILEEYFARINRMVLSRCPICYQDFRHSFDKWGLDGFWWDASTRLKEIKEPENCPHFLLMQGSLNLNSLKPKSGNNQVIIGPGIPYVIPAILKNPETYAVIASINLENGYTAYPIVYFSTRRFLYGLSTGIWVDYLYLGYSHKNIITNKEEYKWDFNLQPWVLNGKLKWIESDDLEFKISTKPLSEFPYYNIKGTKEIQILQGDCLWTILPYLYKEKFKNIVVDEEFSTIV